MFVVMDSGSAASHVVRDTFCTVVCLSTSATAIAR
jgi:hypothetical protein